MKDSLNLSYSILSSFPIASGQHFPALVSPLLHFLFTNEGQATTDSSWSIISSTVAPLFPANDINLENIDLEIEVKEIDYGAES